MPIFIRRSLPVLFLSILGQSEARTGRLRGVRANHQRLESEYYIDDSEDIKQLSDRNLFDWKCNGRTKCLNKKKPFVYILTRPSFSVWSSVDSSITGNFQISSDIAATDVVEEEIPSASIQTPPPTKIKIDVGNVHEEINESTNTVDETEIPAPSIRTPPPSKATSTNVEVNERIYDSANAVDEADIPAASIRTPPPSKATSAIVDVNERIYDSANAVGEADIPAASIRTPPPVPQTIISDDEDSEMTESVTAVGGKDIPAASIRTPPPTITLQEGDTDTTDCPTIYPTSGMSCTVMDGFEYKKCVYYDLGPDALCQCSRSQAIWSCSGTIVNEKFIVVDNNNSLETTIEEIKEFDSLPTPTSSLDASASFTDNTSSDTRFCPIEQPGIGDSCSTGEYAIVTCCYEAVNPYPDTLGTITCTCDKSDMKGFQCYGGSLSTCAL